MPLSNVKIMEIVVDGIVFESQAKGGVSRIYAEILPRMCELSNDVRFILLTAGAIKQPLPSHSRIHHVARPGIQRLLQGRWLANWKSDLRGLILSNMPLRAPGKAIWHSTYYTLPHRWQGLNLLTVPDIIYELFPQIFTHPLDEHFRTYKRTCIEQADAIICISQSAANDLRAYYNPIGDKPIYVVPLACSDGFHQIEDVSACYLSPSEKSFLLYVGGRHHYKNFDQLLKAYSVWKMKPVIDLVVVGEPWNRSELHLIKDLHLDGNIHLRTAVTDGELCYLYNLALALVYPSLYEGFGLPLLEAMQCACPIVASKIPSSVEVAGDCAVYFEPNILDDFVNALTTASNLGRHSKQVKSGLERCRDFSWERCAKMTLDVYSDLLARSR